jgi:site-specific DNA-methyltransferase (cytosine-N4-specific)
LDTSTLSNEENKSNGNIPETVAVDRWFRPKAKKELALIKLSIDRINPPDVRDFCKIAFAGVIRRSSIASPRAGKLFKVPDKSEEDVVSLFLDKLDVMTKAMRDFSERTKGESLASVVRADCRSAPVRSESIPFVFWHPPYYALYRYSAIYMLEMDWLGMDRKPIRAGEIEEGYKTSDEAKFGAYLDDLASVLISVKRILRDNGTCCVVIGDSSFRGKSLPVVNLFKTRAHELGFQVDREIQRKIHFAQASYHPSSKLKVSRPDDVVLYLRKK